MKWAKNTRKCLATSHQGLHDLRKKCKRQRQLAKEFVINLPYGRRPKKKKLAMHNHTRFCTLINMAAVTINSRQTGIQILAVWHNLLPLMTDQSHVQMSIGHRRLSPRNLAS